ncbi:MAG: globin [Planctomycetes bacterium]|nr:globin [Planctomycetota bacterium]
MPTPPPDPVAHLAQQLGEATLRDVVAAFYRRIPSDDLLGPMYPSHDLAGAERRLADFLVQRCGGSPRYSQTRGHPRLRMRHQPFRIDAHARDRWMALMTAALHEVELPDDARSALRAFLGDVATFLMNVPPGAP